jgi:hypothetical protein
MGGLSVCPAAIVAAPVEVVWGNLVQDDSLPRLKRASERQYQQAQTEGK